ncbi:MAG: H-NS histone family protein [Magnetococcales bacterium]|nr:H-NS histone family protein [Magnetococcales bacterium]
MAKEKKAEVEQPKIQTAILELSLKELVSLQADVDRLIKQRQKEDKKDIFNRMQEMAKAAGFSSVAAFMAAQGRSPRSDKGVRMPPKYRNPHDAQQTWSGKGRKPGWVLSHLAGGGELESLKIV